MALLFRSGTPKAHENLWYGVQGDFTSLDYKLTRVGNLELHRTLPIQSKMRRFVENPDGSVKYYLHSDDSRKKIDGSNAIIDSTDGNVMLEIPGHYVKIEVTDTKWTYAISEYALPGFVRIERKTIAPWYSTIDNVNNVAVSGCFLTWSGNEVARDENGMTIFTDNAARYRGGDGAADASLDGTATSQLGMARTNMKMVNVLPYLKDGTHTGAFRAYNTIAWLQRIEYASFHSQDTFTPTLTADGFHQGGLGSGCSVNYDNWNNLSRLRPYIPGGVTATLGNNTGKVSYTLKGWTGGDKVVQVTSYRGFEVPYEYLSLLVADLAVFYNKTGEVKSATAYLCEDPSKFTVPDDDDTAIPESYEAVAQLPNDIGGILTLSITPKGYSFPFTHTGNNVDHGVCDMFYSAGSSGNGWYSAMLSGSGSAKSSSGFGYLNVGSRASYDELNFAWRLCRY